MAAQSGGFESEIRSDAVLAEAKHIAFTARCASGSRSAKCAWLAKWWCSPGSHHRTRRFPTERAAPRYGWEKTFPSHFSLYSKGVESLVTSLSSLRCSPWVPLSLSMTRSLCPPAMRAGGSSCLQADLWSTKLLQAQGVVQGADLQGVSSGVLYGLLASFIPQWNPMHVATAGSDDRHCPSHWTGFSVFGEMDLVLLFCKEAKSPQRTYLTAIFRFWAYRKLLRIPNGDYLLKP